MTEDDTIIFKKYNKRICIIDGIHFDYPRDFADYIVIGLLGLILVITLPFWIPFYILGLIFRNISTIKKRPSLYYLCPNCNSRIVRIEDLYKIECEKCGWYGYLDRKNKKEVKNG